MMQSLTLPRVELSDGAVEAMKWLGLVLMTADHAQKYGMIPAVSGIYEAGRLALPLFGIVLAYNLARVRSQDLAVYVRVLTRLLFCCAIASIPFIALGAWVWVVAAQLYGNARRRGEHHVSDRVTTAVLEDQSGGGVSLGGHR